jgi:hypothetical protein
MTLHCANDEPIQRFSSPCPWLRPDVQASFAEVNEQSLDIMIAQARSALVCALPMVRELRPLLLAIDAGARRRAAACPYLLVDAGFSNPQRWGWAQDFYVADAEPLNPEQYPALPRATSLATDAFTLAWHLTRTRSHAARIALGMHERTSQVLEECSLGQMTRLARSHPHWVQPRWPTNKRMWRGLIGAAISGEGESLERARMRGVQLLAAEARSSAWR